VGLLRYVAGEPEQHRECLSQDGGSAAPELTPARDHLGRNEQEQTDVLYNTLAEREAVTTVCGLPRVALRACGCS